MKVALVHDWLTGMRGGERCLAAFLALYPKADIYTLIHVPGSTSSEIDSRVRQTSVLNRLPGDQRYYRALLPFYPRAAQSLKLNDYDLVVSLSHAVAKNVSVPAGAIHVCYCFTPMRYIWDQADTYFGKARGLAEPILQGLRTWDLKGAVNVDAFVAISNFIAARIRCFYKRSSTVIHPPVDTSWISPPDAYSAASSTRQGEALLYAGALVPYKRADLVVRACKELGLRLWVVGGGPEERKLRALAQGAPIEFFGTVSDAELAQFYRNCRALVFPAVEDFGMVPVECMAAGRPVIGLDKGGLRDTISGVRYWKDSSSSVLVDSSATGVFIPYRGENELDALKRSIRFFLEHEGSFSSEACVQRAQQFSLRVFVENWNTFLTGKIQLGKARARHAETETAII